MIAPKDDNMVCISFLFFLFFCFCFYCSQHSDLCATSILRICSTGFCVFLDVKCTLYVFVRRSHCFQQRHRRRTGMVMMRPIEDVTEGSTSWTRRFLCVLFLSPSFPGTLQFVSALADVCVKLWWNCGRISYLYMYLCFVLPETSISFGPNIVWHVLYAKTSQHANMNIWLCLCVCIFSFDYLQSR